MQILVRRLSAAQLRTNRGCVSFESMRGRATQVGQAFADKLIGYLLNCVFVFVVVVVVVYSSRAQVPPSTPHSSKDRSL